MRQEDEAGGPQDTGKAQEPEGPAEKAGSKKDKYQKAQAKAEYAGEKLGKAREKLDKTEAKRAAKKPPGLAKKAVRGARTEAWFYVQCNRPRSVFCSVLLTCLYLKRQPSLPDGPQRTGCSLFPVPEFFLTFGL